ncbi:hypothetical protein ABE61_18705 [Lysinibacillus sphaericus]|nr:hypothetical protein [Lysinibacillus sphaericus]MBG9479655.1 hypothetical protein [Lysinibacillus sphaericus]MBG9593863.1 hypothetical protein [Lysinibacillus sphaericus]
MEYKVDLDSNWFTKKLTIIVDEHNSLKLTSDGKGKWFENDGQVIDKLKGAIDIDISATPFSNSLPNNRMNWVLNRNGVHIYSISRGKKSSPILYIFN